MQGLSAGVELGGVSVYLSEIAPPGQQGLLCRWQSASQQVAVMFAALLGLMSRMRCSARSDMMAWGWRIPLLIGCLLVPFLFLLRRTLEETDEFQARNASRPAPEDGLRAHWPPTGAW